VFDIAILGEVMIEIAPVESDLYRRGVAGDTYNTACTLTGLGAKCVYLTDLGASASGQMIRDHAGRMGLKVIEPDMLSSASPGLYMISNDASGERSFDYWRDQSACRLSFSNPDLLASMLKKVLDVPWFYLSGITLAVMSDPSRAALRDFLIKYRSNGGTVAFDSNYRDRLWESAGHATQEITKILSQVDVYLPGAEEERLLFGELDLANCVKRMANDGLGEVFVKDGANRCLSLVQGTQGAHKVKKVDQVVDATGAGDSFNGGLLYSRMNDFDTEKSIGFASQVAREVLKVKGGLIPPEVLSALSLSKDKSC